MYTMMDIYRVLLPAEQTFLRHSENIVQVATKPCTQLNNVMAMWHQARAWKGIYFMVAWHVAGTLVVEISE